MKSIENPFLIKSFSVTKDFKTTDADWLPTGLGLIDGYDVVGGYSYCNQGTWVYIVGNLFPDHIGYKCVINGNATIAGKVIYMKTEYIV